LMLCFSPGPPSPLTIPPMLQMSADAARVVTLPPPKDAACPQDATDGNHACMTL
jgi:hypothetical protein